MTRRAPGGGSCWVTFGVTPGENANYNRQGRPLGESLHKRLRLGSLEESLAYIICEPCIGTKDSACVDVCPVDCIHPRKDEPEFEAAEMLYIHPDECIDCGACEPECPVTAIFPEDDVPANMEAYTAKNKQVFDSETPPTRPKR